MATASNKGTSKGPRTILRASAGVKVSPRVFWHLCASNPDLRLERTSSGRLVIMSPAGSDSGRRCGELFGQVWSWARLDATGIAFDSSSGFTFPSGAILAPDASWIHNARWEAVPAADRKRFSPMVPDFVAEVRSPIDRLPALRKKMAHHVEQGVRLGWLIDPKTTKVEIHRPGREVETLDRPTTLPGEEVMPGLVVDLKGILFD